LRDGSPGATLRAGLLLGVALFLCQYRVVFQGGSLIPSDHFDPLSSGARAAASPAGSGLLRTANLHDPEATAWQWEPAGALARASILSGSLPWWNPYAGAGTPEATNPTSALFFPPRLLFLLLFGNGSLANTAYALVVWWLAGWFTVSFLRRHGLGLGAAILGGAAFCASGAMTQTAASLQGQTLACLPLVLWATRWFCEAPTSRRIAGTAAIYALAALSSFVPLQVALFGSAALYVMAFLFTRREEGGGHRAGTALRFCAVIGLSLALAAFFLVPVLRMALTHPANNHYREASRDTIAPENLLQLASPVLLGGDKVQVSPWVATHDLPTSQVPYVGVIVLGLAAAAIRRREGAERTLGLWALVGAIAVAAKLVGLPPLQQLASLPPFDRLHYVPYFAFLLAFPLATGAALGFDDLARGRAGIRFVAISVSTSAATLVAIRWLAAGRLSLGAEAAWSEEWSTLAALAFAAALGISLALAPRGASGNTRRFAGLALIFGTFAIEAYRNTALPRQPRSDFWLRPPIFVERVRAAAGDDRVFTAAALRANTGSAFGIRQLDSFMAFNAPRTEAFYRRGTLASRWLFLDEPRRLPPEGFLSRANVGALVLARSRRPLVEQAEARGYRRVSEDENALVFVRETLPRAFFTSEFEVVDGATSLARAVADPPGRGILLEATPGVASAPDRLDDPPVMARSPTVNRIDLAVDAPRPGFVAVSESWMPGWRAHIEDRAVPLLHANHAFMAVEVPAGRSEIHLDYRPPGLALGTSLSALGLIAVAWLVAMRPRPIPPAESGS
jgi:hypothetical protein